MKLLHRQSAAARRRVPQQIGGAAGHVPNTAKRDRPARVVGRAAQAWFSGGRPLVLCQSTRGSFGKSCWLRWRIEHRRSHPIAGWFWPNSGPPCLAGLCPIRPDCRCFPCAVFAAKCRGVAERQSGPVRRGYRCGHVGQSVSLRHLSAHPHRDKAVRRQHARDLNDGTRKNHRTAHISARIGRHSLRGRVRSRLCGPPRPSSRPHAPHTIKPGFDFRFGRHINLDGLCRPNRDADLIGSAIPPRRWPVHPRFRLFARQW